MKSDDPKRLVRIEGNGVAHKTRVYLGDIDISKYVTHLSVEIGVGKAPLVTIQYLGEVEILDTLETLVVTERIG